MKSGKSTAFLFGRCLCLPISPRELLAVEKTYCEEVVASSVSWSWQVCFQTSFVLSGLKAGPPDVSLGSLSCSLIDLAVRKLFLILGLLLISLSLFQLIGLIVFPLQELSLCILSPRSPQGNLFLLALKEGQTI